MSYDGQMIDYLRNLYKTDTLSGITRDLGQVFFASVFLNSLMSDSGDNMTIIAGLVLAFFSWCLALLLATN